MQQLAAMSDPARVESMANAGITIPQLRKLAKQTGTDHDLAAQLWASGVHEARILASMIDDPRAVTPQQMNAWVVDLDSWDVCDQLCQNLFGRTLLAWDKAVEWSSREATFVKRAGFVLMTRLVITDKQAPDWAFESFLPVIEREAHDGRKYVKKAVNWALRQIGKRNRALNAAAIATAERIARQETRAARWVARHALRELQGDKVQKRLAQP